MHYCRFFTFALVLLWAQTVAAAAAADTVPSPGLPIVFREPTAQTYLIPAPNAANLRLLSAAPADDWLHARRGHANGMRVELGRRIVLQLADSAELEAVVGPHPLRLTRRVQPGLFILEARTARLAVEIAAALAQDPRVTAAYPIARRYIPRTSAYAAKPNDPYFPRQWHLENRDPATGARRGADLNARAAWPHARGTGVLIACADDGVEYTHPDLARPATGRPHFNFVTGVASGLPVSSAHAHGTAVAGLAAAQGGNRLGISGVAPEADLASWVIFGQTDFIIDEEKLMEMFQFRSNIVSVQNHSWGNASTEQLRPGLLESAALSNVYTFGRGGLGIVMCRPAGNGRESGNNVNDDGYAADPRAITVGAVRSDGRVASYSSPGAPILVAAPSGDAEAGFPNVFTTDRQGTLGLNRLFSSNDLADYAFEATGFTGTSAATPQVSGLCALILSANPQLHVRDVQRILALAAAPLDLADPDLGPNGAGFLISHNTGFGIPDAGKAVRLAQRWNRLPPAEIITLTTSNKLGQIPDAGLRVILSGPTVPTNLQSLVASPMIGLHPDEPTQSLPMVHAGSATTALTIDLTGRAPLIQRGVNFFSEKIEFAAAAGASFVIIYNNVNRTERIVMGGTDFARIPAVMISQQDGEALRDLLASGASANAQLRTDSLRATFDVNDTLICEHVGVRIQTDHQARGDLRITLRSPSGTWSVLQTRNNDRSSDLLDWTYYSTRHFFESSAGTWEVRVTDEWEDLRRNSGSLLEVSLIIRGVRIQDQDRDGLDDAWETKWLGSLDFGPKDDPDNDGSSNAREQAAGTHPKVDDDSFRFHLSVWDERLVRLSWPGRKNRFYEILQAPDAAAPLSTLTNLVGRFPEMEFFLPYSGDSSAFLQGRVRDHR